MQHLAFESNIKPFSKASANESSKIKGYASHFGKLDKGGDIVMPGAFAKSLENLKRTEQKIKMLWQHEPQTPIGVWDNVREDEMGLWVEGRILHSLHKGHEAATLVKAGAIDGLSVGYKTIRSRKNKSGQRLLIELELWEISIVTFPMLGSARINAKAAYLHTIKALLQGSRRIIKTL